ncbi:MAG TPA: ribonuclease J [Coriobacteriia bacterium]
MTSKKPPRLRVIPLGGLDEIGKNMTVLEYGDDMVLIDAGIMFPDVEMPGVDLVLPDYSYVLQRRDKLRGIVITHGHEDHTGALPYLMRDLGLPVPILGTKLTLGLVSVKLEEFRIKRPKLREVRSGMHVSLGVFGFDFIQMNHSIPDSVALLVHTPVGNILHTGDFKFDQTPIDGRATDYAALSKAGKDGVLLLMSDSTGAEHPGYTHPEAEVGRALDRIIAEAPERVIVASFASHIHRVQQVCDAAVACGRKVVVTGRSMLNYTRIARELGYLQIDETNIFDAYQMNDLAPREICILSTGSQGEPLSALARMANGDHRTVTVARGDTIVISASPVPGNEKAVSRVINRMFKAGAEVYHRGIAEVHVSGHASAEELKLMLQMTKPRYFVPIHGETRHLHAHAAIARQVGVAERDIFMLENGQCLEIGQAGARIADHVPSGVVYVDGLSVGDVGEVVLRDRQQLSSDGIITVVVAIDAQTGRISGDVEIVARGLVLGADTEEVLDEARARVSKALGKAHHDGATDHGIIQHHARETISQFVWERVRRRPMIIPIVVEV